MKLFYALVVNPGLECEFVGVNIVNAHQYSSGAAFEQGRAIGKSVAGNTTKIHTAVDLGRLPIYFPVYRRKRL